MNKIAAQKYSRQIIIYTIFVAGILFLFWKAKYGYIFNDEPFIITLAHRLTLGDALLVDEWNATQMTGFLIYPLVFLYKFINGSMEGIILTFRYTFVVLWTLVSIILYRRIRKYGLFCGIFAAAYFILFSPLEQMALSYNMISLAGFTLVCISLIHISSWWQYILAGSIFAIAVLCSPFSILIYFLYTLCVLVLLLFRINLNKTRFKALYNVFNIKTWIWFSVGAIIVSTIFIVFVFSRANLHEVTVGLNNILSGLAKETPFITRIINYAEGFVKAFDPLAFFWFPIILISMLDRNKLKHRLYIFSLQTFIFLIAIFYLQITVEGLSFNLLMLPLSILGLQAYILTKNKQYDIFVFFWVFGILYSIGAFWGSDTGISAISMATTISGIGSIILVKHMIDEMLIENKKNARVWTKNSKNLVCNENKNSSLSEENLNESLKTQKPFQNKKIFNNRYLVAIMTVIFVLQIESEIYIRYNKTYLDEDTNKLSSEIASGPAKGIITTEFQAKFYEDIYDDLLYLKTLVKGSDNRILFMSMIQWAYLEMDQPYGTFSAWTCASNSRWDVDWLINRLLHYYSIHEESIPKLVYVLKSDITDIRSLNPLINKYNYSLKESKIAYILIKN